MVTELITFKLDSEFLDEVDSISKESGFSSRTDFIRNALREKINEIRLREAWIRLSKFKGKSKKKTTNKEMHIIREKALKELLKKKGFV